MLPMSIDARLQFADLARLPDEEIDLDRAALLIARETDETVDVDFYLGFLDQLADNFRKGFERDGGPGISVSSLIDFIHREEGFTGNVKDYYDPSNSFLSRVIDTRQGIPISLALVHIALGKRLDLPVFGINFPGHFLVRYGDAKHEIVDPFAGRILSRPDCSTLLRQIAGPRAVLQDEYFDAASNREILVRILDNLKQIFWRKKSWDESKACIDRQLLLLPERAELNIQLGAVYEMQGKVPQARTAYTEALLATSDDKLRESASKRLLALESKPRTVH